MENNIKPDEILCLEKVSFSYPQADKQAHGAVRDVSFCLKKGERFSLLGPSGCGKTSLLRIIAGLQTGYTGALAFNACVNNSDSPAKIGMVFQDLALFPHMSVARNVGFALRHLPRAERRHRVDELLALVNLQDKRGAYPHQLSGGQKQRLALARSLAPKPSLILLDEPFASQDSGLRQKMREEVTSILQATGVAAMLVTHDPEEAFLFADRVAVMRAGRIEQIGTPQEIYTQPKSPFVASFFGQVNQVAGVVKDGFFHSPLGIYRAPAYDDGTRLKAIIRPEAIGVSPHDPAIDHHEEGHRHTHAYIKGAQYRGASSLLAMAVQDIDNQDMPSTDITVSLPSVYAPAAEGLQDIYIDERKIIYFEEK